MYERRDDVLDVLHTYTPPALRGGNLAAELTRAALDHARAEGLRTGFVPRPQSYGPDRVPDLTPDPSFDVVATDFVDFARQMGV